MTYKWGKKTMRYHNITKDDMLNGDGLRVVLWLAGCSHHCKNCQNPITWDPDGGLIFDEAAKQEIYEELDKDYVSGITFSGGDPLFETNREELTAFVREIKTRYPDKTIWLYTGYQWEQIHEIGVDSISGCSGGWSFCRRVKRQCSSVERKRKPACN